MKNTQPTTFTIDATDKTLGRTASAVAKLLMGKDNTSFEKNIVSTNKVSIINASKASIDPKKLTAKFYERYSGYPGGLTKERMDMIIARKGYSEVFKLAVYGMLPGNKLRARLMKNLTVSE